MACRVGLEFERVIWRKKECFKNLTKTYSRVVDTI